ncbi:hypothetical protein FSP39_013213 [Pinctada imbricata]|uniref:Uncharacterized protein n=1 Tax=Pinctada imbricata TaxID=66713 RepID=A0AA88Y0D9_PINIB|nr:hypothetical protein FSP39_013213 [Pinctada imbricata]
MLHSEFVRKMVIRMKELKDLVSKSLVLYEADRIQSRHIIATLQKSTLRTECGFPGPPRIISRNNPERSISQENIEAHREHFKKLQQVQGYLNIVFWSEDEFEYGCCSEHFAEKEIKFRDILHEMKLFLLNSGVSFEMTDEMDANFENSCDYLKSMRNRFQRFCRDYLILKDTETFCEELIRACSCYECVEEHD